MALDGARANGGHPSGVASNCQFERTRAARAKRVVRPDSIGSGDPMHDGPMHEDRSIAVLVFEVERAPASVDGREARSRCGRARIDDFGEATRRIRSSTFRRSSCELVVPRVRDVRPFSRSMHPRAARSIVELAARAFDGRHAASRPA
jgi:hypothetical protein